MLCTFEGPVFIAHPCSGKQRIRKLLAEMFSDRYEKTWLSTFDAGIVNEYIRDLYSQRRSLVLLGYPFPDVDVVDLINRFSEPQGQIIFVILTASPYELKGEMEGHLAVPFDIENLIAYSGEQPDRESLWRRLDSILGFP